MYDLDTLVPEVSCVIDDFHRRAWTDPKCEAFNGDGPFGYNSSAWKRTIIVPAGAHDCAAHTYLPSVMVSDDWSGVKAVKAQFNGATYQYVNDNPSSEDGYGAGESSTWSYHGQVKVPKTDWPEMIVVEAFDECHLVGRDTCYIMTKDQTDPVAVVDKGLTVSLSDKKIWVNAESFDEGSWDNCGDPRIFVRRADWYESCIDLCTNIDGDCTAADPTTTSSLEFCYAGEHHDTLWIAQLETDKSCNPVEAHYSKMMEWLCHDGTACGELLYNAWVYDLTKRGTLQCGGLSDEHAVDKLIEESLMLGLDEDEIEALIAVSGDIGLNEAVNRLLDAIRIGKFKINLPYLHSCDYFPVQTASAANRVLDYILRLINLGTMNLSETEIERLIDGITGEEQLTDAEEEFYLNSIAAAYDSWLAAEIDNYAQIGGGWSDAVPFDCTDACESVTVEVLAIDYWCNWSRGWTEVWVEDKTPVEIAKDVTTEITISCKTFKDLGLDSTIPAAEGGDAAALASLESTFGGYVKAWKDAHGNLIDGAGDELDCDIALEDSVCYCRDTMVQLRVHDEHLGYIWKDSSYSICGYNLVSKDLTHGAIVVNCAENVSCSQSVWSSFDHCGEGVIYRKFKVWQGCGDPPDESRRSLGGGEEVDTVVRLQKIYVENQCPVEDGMFAKPADAVIDACGIIYDPDGSGNVAGAAHPDSTGYLTYTFDDDCRIVGVGHYDKVFKVVGGDGSCLKIIRTWCYMDWCDGEPTDDWMNNPRFEDRIGKYVQKIVVRDETPPTISIEPVTDAAARGSCDFRMSTMATVADACGLINYSWQVVNTSDNSIAASGAGSIDGDTTSNFMIEPTVAIAPGSYTIQAIVRDECQNEMAATSAMSVTSDKKPGVVCLTSLTAELTPVDTDQDGVVDDGCAVVWAQEYESSMTTACSDDSLALFIEKLDGINDDTLDPEDADSLKVTCADYDPSTPLPVRLWVVSLPSGAMDYCDLVLVLQNNMGACQISRSDVSGFITNELEESVEEVEVKATLANGQALNFLTNTGGVYRIANALGIEMMVSPKKDSDHLNGISTADLIKIQKHILGKEVLQGYRLVAADANADEKINALDLIELRKLILGVQDQLLNSDSWRFANSIDGKDSYQVRGSDAMRLDFTGIKIGDVNLDSDPSRSMSRSSERIAFTTRDRALQLGDLHRIEFTPAPGIAGYQFTMAVDHQMLKIVSVGGLAEDHFGLQLMEEGMVSASWHQSAENSAEGEVITLVVEAIQDVQLSNAIALNSAITTAEAYTGDIVHDIALEFIEASDDADFALQQNQPNPFKGQTTVDFVLPEDLQATLTVYDVTGKVVMVREGDFSKGINRINLTRGHLKNASGVLYYQLDTDEYTATRKMIVLD
ncbi:MAG: T9SS type A sorting domain-containing protein [Saprospiraceae bacterium]|nr:T9SS type A sorting domain-containing protein [Saprospiraceae bacterium]